MHSPASQPPRSTIRPPSLWRRRTGRVRGFTLVELLVSLALGSMILLIIAKVFAGASQVFTVSTQSTEIYSTARIVLDIMAEQVSSITPEWQTDGSAVPPAPVNHPHGVTGNDAAVNGQDQLQMRFYVPGSSVQIVEYRVDADGALAWGFDDTGAWNPTQFRPILKNVKAFDVGYYNAHGGGTSGWRHSWDNTYWSLPTSIAVTITVSGVVSRANQNPEDLSFVRVMQVPVTPTEH